MKTEFTTGSATTVNYNTQPPRRNPSSLRGIECDTVHTSNQSLLLSRSLTPLKEQMLPRADMLRLFAGSLDAGVELDDLSLDRILGQL